MAGNTAPQRDFVDAQGILDLVTLDPADTIWTPPQGYSARLRWLYAPLRDSGGPPNLSAQIQIFPNADATALQLKAIPANINFALQQTLFSNEVGTPTIVADATGTTTTHVSYNPLPLVTIDQTGNFQLSFLNGTPDNPGIAQVELFQTPQASAGGRADLYLLPALG